MREHHARGDLPQPRFVRDERCAPVFGQGSVEPEPAAFAHLEDAVSKSGLAERGRFEDGARAYRFSGRLALDAEPLAPQDARVSYDRDREARDILLFHEPGNEAREVVDELFGRGPRLQLSAGVFDPCPQRKREGGSAQEGLSAISNKLSSRRPGTHNDPHLWYNGLSGNSSRVFRRAAEGA